VTKGGAFDIAQRLAAVSLKMPAIFLRLDRKTSLFNEAGAPLL
jgi:hypothetical protein